MSSDENQTSEEEYRPDYTAPIARTGEQQFAAIIRNRSGIDAGTIDSATRDISHLSDVDKQDAVDAAFIIYETFCIQTGKRSKRERQ